jgi:acyl-CoA synthetase (AMP-forming)/AMP-acid ligase II
MAVPTLWRRLLEYPEFDKYDLSSLKVAMGASDSMPKDLLEEVLKRCPASSPQLYGLSEGGILTYLNPKESMKKIGSSGKPHCQAEIRLVDDNGQDVPLGAVGEIICRGEHTMSYYWDMPEETKTAIREGWLYTGDLGKFDEEGYIYIVGRKKDMIISGGQNIYPAEIEKKLLLNPKIEEVAVIGIPDREWGESVMALVVLKKNENMSEEELINYVKENMASYNKPRFVKFLDALPRTTATGKIQKAELRKQVALELSI